MEFFPLLETHKATWPLHQQFWSCSERGFWRLMSKCLLWYGAEHLERRSSLMFSGDSCSVLSILGSSLSRLCSWAAQLLTQQVWGELGPVGGMQALLFHRTGYEWWCCACCIQQRHCHSDAKPVPILQDISVMLWVGKDVGCLGKHFSTLDAYWHMVSSIVFINLRK